MWPSVLAFTAVAALLTVTPGVDTALVIRNTVTGGPRYGQATSAGVCSGLLSWGLLSALGVSAVLTASRVAFDALRIAGAAYLLLFGVRTLLAARRGDRAGEETVGAAAARPRRMATGFRTGMATNLLNPKVGVFYVTLLPQFVPAGARVLPTTMLLAGIHAVEGIVWLLLLTLAVSRVRAAMRRSAVRRSVDGVTGIVLIGFGARVAAERL